MLHEIGLAFVLVLIVTLLQIILNAMHWMGFIVIVGLCALEMLLLVKWIGVSWEKAFFACFLLLPAISVVEILIFSHMG